MSESTKETLRNKIRSIEDEILIIRVRFEFETSSLQRQREFIQSLLFEIEQKEESEVKT